jgi:hypothetical protein
MRPHKKSQAGPVQGMAAVRRRPGYQSSDQEMLRSGYFSHPTWNASGTIVLEPEVRFAYFPSTSTDADFQLKKTFQTTRTRYRIASWLPYNPYNFVKIILVHPVYADFIYLYSRRI